jgi:hypothetical protein
MLDYFSPFVESKKIAIPKANLCLFSPQGIIFESSGPLPSYYYMLSVIG